MNFFSSEREYSLYTDLKSRCLDASNIGLLINLINHGKNKPLVIVEPSSEDEMFKHRDYDYTKQNESEAIKEFEWHHNIEYFTQNHSFIGEEEFISTDSTAELEM